jgi:lipoprotein-releasing system ATP-binding protein
MMVVEARDLVKSYRGGDNSLITVLNGVNLQVARGEMVAITGASGAGKSTLLHLLGALDRPTRGHILLAGVAVNARSGAGPGEERGGLSGRVLGRRKARRDDWIPDDELADLRNRTVGFVFQFHHLLREFSAIENVMMPLRIAEWETRRARSRAEELLARVGLSGRMHHRPSELSGGEQQRTAVARALAIDPAILLADEPSGNLDKMNSELLHDLFAELAKDLEIAMVVVTHNPSLAARAHRALLLESGRLRDTDVHEVVG